MLALYPEMVETPSADVIQRTEWNIRDSSCTVVLTTHEAGTSPGTDAGFAFNEKYGVPHFELYLDDARSMEEQLRDACDWLRSLDDEALVLAFGGPCESEYPGVYDIAFSAVETILMSQLSAVD